MFYLAILASANSYAEDESHDADPWIGLNQVTHGFNDTLDRVLLRPTAIGYSKVVPGPVRRRIGNVFANLDDINDAVNNLLQGKVG